MLLYIKQITQYRRPATPSNLHKFFVSSKACMHREAWWVSMAMDIRQRTGCMTFLDVVLKIYKLDTKSRSTLDVASALCMDLRGVIIMHLHL